MAVRVILVVALGVLIACDESSPTELVDPLDPAATAALLPAVKDAAVRLMPAVADAAVAVKLTELLAALEHDMEALDGTHARENVEAAGRVLGEYSGRSGDDAPDVTAIRLMLVHVAMLAGARLDAVPIP